MILKYRNAFSNLTQRALFVNASTTLCSHVFRFARTKRTKISVYSYQKKSIVFYTLFLQHSRDALCLFPFLSKPKQEFFHKNDLTETFDKL